MIKINREMTKTETIETSYPLTQASFNSNGCLTVRKYGYENKDKDEIIIFNQAETHEIISLFRQVKDLLRMTSDDIPF